MTKTGLNERSSSSDHSYLELADGALFQRAVFFFANEASLGQGAAHIHLNRLDPKIDGADMRFGVSGDRCDEVFSDSTRGRMQKSILLGVRGGGWGLCAVLALAWPGCPAAFC
jgi:hypothetical protein